MSPQLPAPRRVRFDAIGEAWRLYMTDMAQWICGVLLAGIIAAAPVIVIELIVFAVFVPGGMFGGGAATLGSTDRIQSFRSASLIIAFVALPFNACTQLLTVGLQRRALLQARGLPSAITDMFSLGGMGLHVLVFNVLAAIIGLPWQLYYAYAHDPANPFSLFEPTHAAVLGGIAIAMGAIHVLIGFTPLIIVDQRLAVGPALTKSVTTFAPQFLPLVGVLICTYLLAFCGAIACGIGVLFTLPVLMTLYGVIYNDFFRPNQVATADQPTGWYPRPG